MREKDERELSEIKQEESEDISKYSVEELLKKLEEIVSKLESNSLTLEESIELFNRGVLYSKRASQLLKGAELKIKELSSDIDWDIDGDSSEGEGEFDRGENL